MAKSPATKAKATKSKAGKAKAARTEAPALRPVKETFTKAALINLIAEQNDIPRKTAVGVFATLESVLLGSVHPRGVGEFTLPGLLKITLRKVPARRAGTLRPQSRHWRDDEGRRQTSIDARKDQSPVEIEDGRLELSFDSIGARA